MQAVKTAVDEVVASEEKYSRLLGEKSAPSRGGEGKELAAQGLENPLRLHRVHM
jgi:hypothetical protein